MTCKRSLVQVQHRPPFYFHSKSSIRKILAVCGSISMDRTSPFIYGFFRCDLPDAAPFSTCPARITHLSLPEPRSVSFLAPFLCFNLSTPFGGGGAEVSGDVIQTVSLAKGHFGRCVEIYSRNPRRRQTWLTSPDLIARIYCNDAAEIERIIRQTMAGNPARQSYEESQ